MIKLIILTGLFLSLKAFAGQECKLSLSHTEDLKTTIAEGTLSAHNSDMRSILIKDFFVESEKGNKKQSIALKVFLNGWSGEEEIVIAAFRRNQKRSNSTLVNLSEKVSLRGDHKDTLWFDSYKLDIDCALN